MRGRPGPARSPGSQREAIACVHLLAPSPTPQSVDLWAFFQNCVAASRQSAANFLFFSKECGALPRRRYATEALKRLLVSWHLTLLARDGLCWVRADDADRMRRSNSKGWGRWRRNTCTRIWVSRPLHTRRVCLYSRPPGGGNKLQPSGWRCWELGVILRA